MNSKQVKQVEKLVSQAMSKLQDAREALRVTDAEEAAETLKENYQRKATWQDIDQAISKLKWTLEYLKEMTEAK